MDLTSSFLLLIEIPLDLYFSVEVISPEPLGKLPQQCLKKLWWPLLKQLLRKTMLPLLQTELNLIIYQSVSRMIIIFKYQHVSEGMYVKWNLWECRHTKEPSGIVNLYRNIGNVWDPILCHNIAKSMKFNFIMFIEIHLLVP